MDFTAGWLTIGNTKHSISLEQTMRKRTTGLILTGILLTGAAGAVAITPASATTSDNIVSSRLASIKSALSGLVKDGALTQAQADKVATTLDSKLPQHGMGGPGGMGGHFGMGMAQTHEAAAKALGMTSAQLTTALQSGKSLAAIAKDQKVSVDSLVKAMVAAAQSQLATSVKDGKITQAQADAMKTSLTQRITDKVNGVWRGHGLRGDESPRSNGTSGTSSGATSSSPSNLPSVTV